jgi:hypothetical protein
MESSPHKCRGSYILKYLEVRSEEGRREGAGMEGGKEGGREGREGGREEGKEGVREGGSEGGTLQWSFSNLIFRRPWAAAGGLNAEILLSTLLTHTEFSLDFTTVTRHCIYQAGCTANAPTYMPIDMISAKIHALGKWYEHITVDGHVGKCLLNAVFQDSLMLLCSCRGSQPRNKKIPHVLTFLDEQENSYLMSLE